MPRTQDLGPVIEETTGLYGIQRESLLERGARIGQNPEFIKVNKIEAIDIDVMSDLELARMIDNKTDTNSQENDWSDPLRDNF